MEKLIWKTSGDYAIITGRYEKNPVLIIPPEIDGHEVVAIKAEAFAEDNVLEVVNIKANLNSIGGDLQ